MCGGGEAQNQQWGREVSRVKPPALRTVLTAEQRPPLPCPPGANSSAAVPPAMAFLVTRSVGLNTSPAPLLGTGFGTGANDPASFPLDYRWRRRESNPGPQGVQAILVHVRSRDCPHGGVRGFGHDLAPANLGDRYREHPHGRLALVMTPFRY